MLRAVLMVWAVSAVLGEKVLNSPTKNVQDSPQCELCTFIIESVDGVLAENATQAEVTAFLQNLCDKLNEPIKQMCREATPLIIKAMDQGLDPTSLCLEIGLCQGSGPKKPTVQENNTPLNPKNPINNSTCALCETLVAILDEQFANKTDPAKDNKTITDICKLIPKPSLRTTCLTFVPVILDMFKDGVDPAGACANLGLCDDVRRLHVDVGASNESCAACKALVATVDEMTKGKIDPVKANETIYTICRAMPQPPRFTCLTYAPYLLIMVMHGVSPQGACTNMGLCVNVKQDTEIKNKPSQVPASRLSLPRRLAPSAPQDSPYCQLCELLVQAADQYLQDNKTEAAINQTVYNLCGDLPGSVKIDCLIIAPDVVSSLVKGVDPKTACTVLKLCTAAQVSRLPLPRRLAPSASQDSPYCQLCELLVQAADQYLQDNATEAAINQTVYNLCGDLPDSVKGPCLLIAPQIVASLEKGVDPKTACTALKLCTAAQASGLSLPRSLPPSLPQDSPYCQLCELLVQAADQYLQDNATEAAINQTVYNLCSDLPDSVKGPCLLIAPQIVASLVKGVDPKTACTALKLCTANTGSQLPDPQDSPYCQLCELLVQSADAYLQDNKTEAAINQTVYNLCGDLPGSVKGPCLLIAPQIVSSLVKGVDPKTACTALKLCTANKAQNVPETVKDLVPQDTAECTLCLMAIRTVDELLKENKTVAAINSTVYKLCEEVPGSLKDTCLSMAPQIVAAITKGTDARTACIAIKACTSAVTFDNTPVSKAEDLAAPGPACQICELLVNTLDQYLHENSSLAKINETVYNLCNDLPDSVKATCLALAPQVVSTIAKGVDPKTACTAAKFCVTAEGPSMSQDLAAPGPACQICELLVNTLDQYLHENSSLAKINETVYNLCNDLPDSVKATCLALAPQVVSTIAKGVDPKTACTAAKLCVTAEDAEAGPLSRVLLRTPSKAGNDSVWCTVCKNHLGVIDNDLYRDEDAILKVMEDVCHRLPPPTDQACLTTVDGRFPKFWEDLLNGTASPNSLCHFMGLCNSTALALELLSEGMARLP